MALRLTTPSDSRTGLIPPILPSEPDPEMLRTPEEVSDHHANHPKQAHIDHVAYNALRNSQVHVVENRLHNDGPRTYHSFYKGRRPVQTNRTVFERVFWACTGLLPEEGIDIASIQSDPTQMPFVRPITSTERRVLRTLDPDYEFGYEFIRQGYEPIRDFMRGYILSLSIDRYRSGVVDFVSEENEDKQRAQGAFLIKQAIHQATDPLRKLYAERFESGMLHPAMPNNPDPIVRYKLGSPDNEADQLLILQRFRDEQEQLLRAA